MLQGAAALSRRLSFLARAHVGGGPRAEEGKFLSRFSYPEVPRRVGGWPRADRGQRTF